MHSQTITESNEAEPHLTLIGLESLTAHQQGKNSLGKIGTQKVRGGRVRE